MIGKAELLHFRSDASDLSLFNFQNMTHEENWNAFIDELRAYVQEFRHFPNKHTRLLSRVKYTRKKINDGTLEEWKKEQFLEVANMRRHQAIISLIRENADISQVKMASRLEVSTKTIERDLEELERAGVVRYNK